MENQKMAVKLASALYDISESLENLGVNYIRIMSKANYINVELTEEKMMALFPSVEWTRSGALERADELVGNVFFQSYRSYEEDEDHPDPEEASEKAERRWDERFDEIIKEALDD